ncbi:Chloroperoxidase [Xylariales sp. PMI_506]|nr:Chloroperoxidase [Xylariales sp. PMI_506]
MRVTSALLIALSSIAVVKGCDPDGHWWHPAKADDSRSPCPMVNALANHGYLPRSGRDIDLATVQQAFSDALNYADDTFVTLVDQVLTVSTTGNSSTFNLEDLATHGVIEHDGSLSRNDYYFGDDLHFDPAIWATTASRYGIVPNVPVAGARTNSTASNTSSSDVISIETAAKARAARVVDAGKVNPDFNFTNGQLQSSYGETSVMLATFYVSERGGAPKSWIKALFEQERIPFFEGFTRSSVQLNLTNVEDMVALVAAVPV